MRKYLDILEVRGKIEKINLFDHGAEKNEKY